MSEQPAITSLTDVKASVGPGHPEGVVDAAYEAAEAYVGKRVTWADPDSEGNWPPAPADLVQAVKLQTARYLARRASPNGLVDFGELGMARVPGLDADVARLIAPYRRVVMA